MKTVGALGRIPRWELYAEREEGEGAMTPLSYPGLGRGNQTLSRFVVILFSLAFPFGNGRTLPPSGRCEKGPDSW